MAVLKNMMAKRGRVCEKVGGKQKCPDCKSFSKEPKHISAEMEAAMDMIRVDTRVWHFQNGGLGGFGGKPPGGNAGGF